MKFVCGIFEALRFVGGGASVTLRCRSEIRREIHKSPTYKMFFRRVKCASRVKSLRGEIRLRREKRLFFEGIFRYRDRRGDHRSPARALIVTTQKRGSHASVLCRGRRPRRPVAFWKLPNFCLSHFCFNFRRRSSASRIGGQ